MKTILLDKTVAINMQNLRAQAEANGGVMPVSMRLLRDAAGYGKLGRHVVRDIADMLRFYGMATLPSDGPLPSQQNETVHVYVLKSPVADLVDAVNKPSVGGDRLLRDVGAAISRGWLRASR